MANTEMLQIFSVFVGIGLLILGDKVKNLAVLIELKVQN